jgi:L-lactate dehydrogenase complex protein LldG
VQRILAGLARVDADGSLVEAIQAAGIAVDDWRGDRTMAAGYDAGAGVTDVRAAIAETGTLVYASDADHGRGLMLVPPIHLAVVRTRDIIPDMLDYMRQMGAANPAELPASQTLITGPSKTADIEGVLVTGVHGPGAVHVLLVA